MLEQRIALRPQSERTPVELDDLAPADAQLFGRYLRSRVACAAARAWSNPPSKRSKPAAELGLS